MAAERGTSVSALVKQFLTALAKGGDETEQLKRAERLLRDEISEFRAGDRVPGDEAHTRKI